MKGALCFFSGVFPRAAEREISRIYSERCGIYPAGPPALAAVRESARMRGVRSSTSTRPPT